MPMHWDENRGLTIKTEVFVSPVKTGLNWNIAGISSIDPQTWLRSVCPRESFVLLCDVRQTLAMHLQTAAHVLFLCLQEHLCSWTSCSCSLIGTKNGQVMPYFTNRYVNPLPPTTVVENCVRIITKSVVRQILNKLLLNPQCCDSACDKHVKYYFC